MLNLHSAFAEFAPDVEMKDPGVDRDFITEFLLPYFHDLPREELAAKVAEIIALDEQRLNAQVPRRRTVANRAHIL